LHRLKGLLLRRWFLLSLVIGIALTLICPGPVHNVTHFLEPRLVVALALFLMAYTMPSRCLATELARPWAAVWAILISYGLVPVGGLLLGQLSPVPDLRVGLLLSASVPCTLASAVLWTRLAGGNEATALVTTLGTTFLSFVATTFWLTVATGTDVRLDGGTMMLDLIRTLIVPVALGQALRLATPLARLATRHLIVLGVLSQLLVLSVVIKAAAGVGMHIQKGSIQMTWPTLVLCAALGVALHLAALGAGLWSSRWLGFDRPRRIAVAFSCSQKTLPVSLFLYESYYKTAFPLAVIPLLFFHVGQLILDTFIADRIRSKA
jgi:sodium/bile acid cotransporter 7